MKKIFGYLLSGLLAVSCGYDRFGVAGRGDLEGSGTLPDADIALLREHFYGEPFVVRDALTIGGYVVSDDRAGNFFRSFVIDDGSGAIEVRAGFYDLHAYCQRGRRVTIRVGGLAVGMYNGVLQLGAGVNGWSAYRVEEFGTRILLDGYLERDTLFRQVAPLELGIGELRERHCGRLVRIADLWCSGTPAAWADTGSVTVVPATGTVWFRDGAGDSVAVVTSGYASFAGDAVPAGRVALTGVLMYGKFGGTREGFALKIRDTDDVER